MVQKSLLLICFIISLGMSAQELDFEQTGFKIKAVAMQRQKSTLAYRVSEKNTLSRFNLGPILKDNKVAYSPIEETPSNHFTARNRQNTDIKIEPLKSNKPYSFGNDGSIKRVKNIAYKPSSGGNVYDAYCRGVYASGYSN